MKVPAEYDEIRPFEPEELPAVYDRLLSNPQFQQVVNYVMPGVPLNIVASKMHACKTNIDFQKTFCYPFLVSLVEKAAKGMEMDDSAIDIQKRYTFVSNHRDIVLDSAFLDKLLLDSGFSTTCEIAIGDNLLSLPWVKDLVRVNKSFIVERSLSPRQMLMASKRMAEYMHFVINIKHDNIWIAQREGRAKDSNDRTQPAILKMMTMGGEGNIIERLKQLHIVPLAISYEYDPCDYLKAKEFQQKRDIEGFKKSGMDDIINMQTGINGYKGHIHYHCAPCIDSFLDTIDPGMPKGEIYDAIASHIDKAIHSNYMLYAGNYISADLLANGNEFASHYTTEEKQYFEHYIEGQIAKIDLENKDVDFLRERILTMYANPMKNYTIANKRQ
jgi:hypothetical protein